MGSRSQVVPPPPPGFVPQTVVPPPPGFVLETIAPPPPPGFVLEGKPEPTATSVFRPLGPVGRAHALAPTPEEAPALEEAGRAFLETPLLPLTKLLPEGPPTATVTLPRRPSRFGPRVALLGQGVRADETVDFPIGGVARGAVEFAEGLTTPANIALIASIGLTAGAFPIVTRLISAGFSIDLIRGAVQQYPELREALNSGDEQRVAQVATRMGLTGVLAVLTGRHAVRGRTAAGEVSKARADIERAAEPKPARPTEALPAPAPVSAREAADLGVSAERVPEVLRRQREAQSTGLAAAERQPRQPSPILAEPPPPGFVLERPLPGMERAVPTRGENTSLVGGGVPW